MKPQDKQNILAALSAVLIGCSLILGAAILFDNLHYLDWIYVVKSTLNQIASFVAIIGLLIGLHFFNHTRISISKYILALLIVVTIIMLSINAFEAASINIMRTVYLILYIVLLVPFVDLTIGTKLSFGIVNLLRKI